MRPPRLPPILGALAAVVAAAVGGIPIARDARGDGPTAEMRTRVEDAFVDGRLDELEQLSAPGEDPLSVEPLAVRDLFWRPIPGAPAWPLPRPDVDGTSLSARRLAWLAAAAAARSRGEAMVTAPYPAPAAGEVDPYPRITAWVRDRLLRETEGTTAMDRDGPLGDLTGDELSTYWVKAFRRPAIAGPEAEDADEATRARRRAVREGAVRARAFGLASLGCWILVGGLLLGLRSRRVKPPPPRTDA